MAANLHGSDNNSKAARRGGRSNGHCSYGRSQCGGQDHDQYSRGHFYSPKVLDLRGSMSYCYFMLSHVF